MFGTLTLALALTAADPLPELVALQLAVARSRVEGELGAALPPPWTPRISATTRAAGGGSRSRS